MKARRRHELKENALKHAFNQARDFVKRNGTRISWGVLIVALIVAVVLFAINRQRRRAYELQNSYDALMAKSERDADWVAQMKSLADQDGDERLAAWASLAVGDEYRRIMAVGGVTELPPAEAANSYYERALSLQPDSALVFGRGRYGLAKLAEATGDFDDAARRYEVVISGERLVGYPVVALAEMAKKDLNAIREPVAMVARRTTTRPASLPTTTAAATTSPAEDD